RMAPLADLVRAAVGLPTEPATAVAKGAVEQRLRRLGRRLDASLQVDLLLTLLGYGERPDPRAGEWVSEESTDAEGVAGAVAGLLSALAKQAPLLVIVDDLHDATPEAVTALGATLSRVTGPVLTLLLGRPELVRTSGALTAFADAEVTTLPPLRGADAARLLTSYLGGGRLSTTDEDKLLATAQGNPFYLAELVTVLVERGLLTRVSGRGQDAGKRGEAEEPSWRLAPGSLSSRLLSRDLAAVLAARIDA